MTPILLPDARQCFLALGLLLAACGPATDSPTQQPAAGQVTLDDYRRAEQFLEPNVSRLVYDTLLASYWQDDDRLVYRKRTPQGLEYVLVDPAAGTRAALLDPARLAPLLSDSSGETVDAGELVLGAIELLEDGRLIDFTHDSTRYRLDTADYTLQELPEPDSAEFLSPDGSRAAYLDDHNLWVRDTATGLRTQLTFDGEPDYGYATNNAGWTRRDGPVLLWSPDSRRIATFRHDGRQVGEMALVSTRVGHPDVDIWKYPLPGDEAIFMIERVVIHLEDPPRLVRLNRPPDPHRSTVSDHIAGSGGVFLDVEWNDDGSQLAFVSSSRDHRDATLQVADPDTGTVRTVYVDSVATYYESGSRTPNWRVWPEQGEFLWYSEQDNWGHLYLHDLASGELKRQLTSGDWLVLQVQQVDREAGQLYFTGSNREPGDPYFHYLYRLDVADGNLVNLTPDAGHHEISWSDSGRYFIDTWSTPVQPPRSVLRDRSGQLVVALEAADIDALLASGWQAPEPFTVKARDGLTDLYGLLYRPTRLDQSQAYPVLNYLYPGPQSGSVGSRAFQAARRDKQALAELGFIVVEVDALGTPGRSKAFHDAWYGDMGDNGLPDQIAAIRELAATRPWMDLDRVGIWGHSGGGFASTAGILRYPDFYRVAVSSAGNHDNRNYEDDWGEKWQGLLQTFPERNPVDAADAAPATNYDSQANQLLAGNLQGRLLLAHGLMDSNVHPSSTLLVVDALIKAEKEFDLLLLPNAGHGFYADRYFMQRRWDYFVRHLKQVEPPEDFRFADNID